MKTFCILVSKILPIVEKGGENNVVLIPTETDTKCTIGNADSLSFCKLLDQFLNSWEPNLALLRVQDKVISDSKW